MISLDSSRAVGIVKWFHQDKDFGFIYHENEDGTIVETFFHITQFKPKIIPQPGQIVEYYLTQCARGLRATDCVILKDAALYKHAKIARLQAELQRMFTQKEVLSVPGVTAKT